MLLSTGSQDAVLAAAHKACLVRMKTMINKVFYSLDNTAQHTPIGDGGIS